MTKLKNTQSKFLFFQIEEEYHVYIRIQNTDDIVLNGLKTRDTVAVLKEKIEEKLGIPPVVQRLVYLGGFESRTKFR